MVFSPRCSVIIFLERLQRAFEEHEHTHLSDSTIWEWLEAESLEWKRQQSWFHNAKKRVYTM